MAIDKATLAHRLLGIAEGILSRPFAVRDWILRATSPDGVDWSVDPTFRYNPAAMLGEAMSYYAARGPDGQLWFRSSIRRPAAGVWETVLDAGGRRLTVDHAVFGQLMAPVWVGQHLYCVLVRPGEPPRPACFLAPDVEPSTWKPVPLSFSPAIGAGVQDFHVQEVDAAYVGWLALRADGMRTSIQQWRSRDGFSWRLDKPMILENALPAGVIVANNPWAVAPLADGEPWRLYLRIGEEEAVGNRIVSATSHDLDRWALEPGVRIGAHGQWAAHGVGFPHVERDGPSRWVMHFGGFWGDSRRGAAAAEAWRRANRAAVKDRAAS